MTGGPSLVHAPGSVATPPPRGEPRRTYSWLIVAAILALIVWSGAGTRSDPRVFVHGDAWVQIWTFARAWFPPDLSGDFVRRSLWSGVETIAMSLMGMVLAVLIALPLGIISSRAVLTTSPAGERGQPFSPVRLLHGLVYWGSTLALNVLRSIPEVFWALIFILAVGLGPFAGVLALGVHTGGVLGKLFSEVFENVDPQPIEALHATGGWTGAVVLYGHLPLAFPQLISYTLYRWEVTIRAAAIIGIVGAGGIGREIYVTISLFQYQQLATLLLMTFIVVTLVDYLSAWLRPR
jgi:phosphonate transport system permease protein